MEASAKTGENVEDAFVNTAIQVLDCIKRGVFNLNDEVLQKCFFNFNLQISLHYALL